MYLNSVFHWVEDKRTALAEAQRVLRAGGRIGVNSANADRSHQGAALVREAVLEEGLSNTPEDSSAGSHYRVNAQQLQSLLEQAGFVDVTVTSHTFVDEIAGADDLFAWRSSSSFGNFLSDLSSQERHRVRDRLGQKLEQLRKAQGAIHLERYLVFATARKP